MRELGVLRPSFRVVVVVPVPPGTTEQRNAPWFAFSQEGYGANSVNASAVKEVTAYIQRQEEHHRKRAFEEEVAALLQKHGIAYDPAQAFG